MKRHVVVIARDDGGVEVYPLKEWLRQHPEEVPQGLDATASTSHQLRGGLRKLGWSMSETDTEVRLSKLGSGSFDKFDELLGTTDEFVDVVEVSGGGLPTFSLEYQLRDFIASNLETITVDGKQLRLFVDATGRDGVEYPTAVGPIDILALDRNGAFFVFELKRAMSADKALGQLTRYMGWVKQTIGRDREVFGVIVSKTVSMNLRYAVSVIPNVSLFEYEVNFSLKQAHELT